MPRKTGPDGDKMAVSRQPDFNWTVLATCVRLPQNTWEMRRCLSELRRSSANCKK